MLPGNIPALLSVGRRQTILLTASGAGSWTVPSDWNSSNNSIECIGGGAGGLGGVNAQSGGGGGGYSKSVNLTLTPGAILTTQVGAGGAGSTTTTGNAGGDTWFNSAAFPSSGQACGAKGSPAAVRNAVSPGGASASGYATGTGSLKYSGGSGGAGNDTGNNCGGGGGGAGGPNGNGANGGAGGSPGSGGGGNGGGSNGANGGNGGNNFQGAGGGAMAQGNPGTPGTLGGGGAGGLLNSNIAVGGAGGNGVDVDVTNSVGGGGGGGGGYVSNTVSNATQGGAGGLYGGGGGGSGQRLSATGTGGAGRQGVIIIKYFSSVPAPTTPAVKLLLKMDGADGSTVFTDSSPLLRGNATVGGNAKITSTGAAVFDGAGDYLSYPDSADWAFGSGDFTIEMWARWNVLSDFQVLLAQSGPGSNYLRLLSNTNGLYFQAYDGTTTWQVGLGIAANTWYHVAFVKKAGVLTAYRNGVVQASAPVGTLPDFTSVLTIGVNDTSGTYSFNGYIDDLRITKAAIYTTNFTPPATPANPPLAPIFLTTAGAGTWTVPGDWNNANNSIECIGGGASGVGGSQNAGYAGGGGGYSKVVNQALTPGAVINFSVGAGGTAGGAGGHTWFNGTALASAMVSAEGGYVSNVGPGGRAAQGIGSTKFSGGSGGGPNNYSGGGGGGAAGPNGNGANGGIGDAGVDVNTMCGGGGGGANGGANGGNTGGGNTGGAGGNNRLGYGGGAGVFGGAGGAGVDGAGGGGGGRTGGVSLAGGNGGNGIEWDTGHGAGGGGGCASGTPAASAATGNGGLYGGGGAAVGYSPSGRTLSTGGRGIIVIKYSPP